MIFIVLFFALLAAITAGAVWFAEHPGAVTIDWLGQTADTDMRVLLLGAFVAGLAIALLIEVVRLFWLAPKRLKHSSASRRHDRGIHHLSHGLVAAAAGDVEGARANTRQAEKLLSGPATLLLAAQTAQLEGREDVAHQKYAAMLKDPATEFLGLRGLLAQAIRDGDREEALRLASRARALRPQAPWVLTTLFDLQTRDEAWRGALDTIAEMRRLGQITPAVADRRRALMLHMLARQARAAGKDDEALARAREACKLAPGLAPNDVLVADLAVRAGKPRLAKATLTNAWRYTPHPDIAAAYAALEPKESAANRLYRLRRLCDGNSSHVQSRLTIAEAALNARKFEDAEGELDRAIATEPVARAFRLRAEVERAKGGSPAEVEAWLDKAAHAKPDFAWVCQATGVPRPEWSLFGPMGDFDSLVWTIPAPITRLLPGEATGARLESLQTAATLPPVQSPPSGGATSGSPPADGPTGTASRRRAEPPASSTASSGRNGPADPYATPPEQGARPVAAPRPNGDGVQALDRKQAAA